MKPIIPILACLFAGGWLVSPVVAQSPELAKVLAEMRRADQAFGQQFTVDAIEKDLFPSPLPSLETERYIWRLLYTRDGESWAYDETLDPNIPLPKNLPISHQYSGNQRTFFRPARRRGLVEPDFNGTYQDNKFYRIQSDESCQVEMSMPEARFARPTKSPSYAPAYQIPWIAGRGFSEWIDQIKSVSTERPTELIRCQAMLKSGRDIELLIDPSAGYLVRSAGLHLGSNLQTVSDEYSTSGTLQTPMGIIAKSGSYTIHLDRIHLTWDYEFQSCRPQADSELLHSNHLLLRTEQGLSQARIYDRSIAGH